jgi:hypothetical protein
MKNCLIFLVLFNGFQVLACKCSKNESLQSEFDGTEVVIHGRVLNVEIVKLKSTFDPLQLDSINKQYHNQEERLAGLDLELLKVEFETIQIYKGQKINNIITIYTARGTAACGFSEFEEGKEFIAFLSNINYLNFMFNKAVEGQKKENVFWTNRCTWTSKFDSGLNKEICEFTK